MLSGLLQVRLHAALLTLIGQLFVKMWTLFDYKKAEVFGGHSFLSQRTQQEYDCKDEKRRFLAFTTFPGQMLSGPMNHTDSDTTKWTPVAPGSMSEIQWKIACGKES